MSDDLRNRVARAIYDLSWMYDRTKPWTIAPENEKRLCYAMADAALAEICEPAPVSVREAARVLLGHTSKITAKPLAEMSEAMKIDAHPAILLRGFCAALRAIADGKDDE